MLYYPYDVCSKLSSNSARWKRSRWEALFRKTRVFHFFSFWCFDLGTWKNIQAWGCVVALADQHASRSQSSFTRFVPSFFPMPVFRNTREKNWFYADFTTIVYAHGKIPVVLSTLRVSVPYLNWRQKRDNVFYRSKLLVRMKAAVVVTWCQLKSKMDVTSLHGGWACSMGR